MPVTTHALTGTLSDLVGDAVDPRHTIAWVETNSESGAIVDNNTGGEILLGARRIDIADDGTFEVELPTTAGDTNPTGFQYRVWVEHRTIFGGSVKKARWTSGWFSFTAAADLKDVVEEYYAPPTYASQLTDALDEHAAGLTDDLTAHEATLESVLTQAALGNFDDAMVVIDADDTSDFRVQQDARNDAAYVQTISPLDATYGAAGNDTADDTTELQAALTAAATFGLLVDGRGKTYKTTDTLTIPAGSKLKNLAVHCTTAGKKILNVTGDNVRLERVSIVGANPSAASVDAEYGINVVGASAASPIRNLEIVQCTVELVGMYAMYLKYVSGFRIADCDLGDLGYAGIGGVSVSDGQIEGNTVSNVLSSVVFSSDAYGIFLSRAQSNSLTTDPHSTRVTVSGNIVTDVPWEGIDTHGGDRITISDNIVSGCNVGISCVGSSNASSVVTWAPKRVTITGNTVYSGVTDGSYGSGIRLTGASGTLGSDPALDYATGIIANNVVSGHGKETNNLQGAIQLCNTQGVPVVGNRISQPAPFGICLYYDNRGASVVGNTVMDAWSNSVAFPAAVGLRGPNNTLSLVANTLLNTVAVSATYLNVYGLYSTSATGADVNFGLNYFVAATTAFSSATGVTATFNATITAKDQILAKAGTAGSPGYTFTGDATSGFYSVAAGSIGVAVSGTLKYRFTSTGTIAADGYNMTFGATTGTKIGTSASEKLGFYNATPVVRPTSTPAAATDAATTQALVNDLRSKLITLGLIS